MRLRSYPILRLLIWYILGILLAFYVLKFTIAWYWLIPFLAVSAFLAFPHQYLFTYRYRFLSGSVIYIGFIFLGMANYQYHFDRNKAMYFGRYRGKIQQYEVQINQLPLDRAKSIKLFVKIKSCYVRGQSKQCQGKAILYLQKDSAAQQLSYGDKLIITKPLERIPPAKAPDVFDYRKYLSLQDIHYQAFLRSYNWSKIESVSGANIFLLAQKLRLKLLLILRKNNLNNDELSVAAGMLLGMRDMLSPELSRAYAGAGAMHILCVSGLHVGIIFLIFNFLLKPLQRHRHGKLIKASSIVLIIWFYALLTGLSPSVVRAAAMFSFIIIGQNFRRPVSIIGSLSGSALTLLILNPALIFNLGFQLSYSAVLSIVLLQKPIANLWKPSLKIIDLIWQLISISIAAQIGTAPLTVYYFHQFPSFFILTNLIVIPSAYLVIILGILVIITSPITWISSVIGKALSIILFLLNNAITGIENLPFAVIHNLYLSTSVFVLLIALILSISVWLVLKVKKFIYVNMVLLIFLLIAWQNNYDLSNELIIYPGRTKYIAIYANRKAWIIGDSNLIKHPNELNYFVENHEMHKGIKKRILILQDTLSDYTTSYFSFRYPYLKIGNRKLKFIDNTRINTSFDEFDVDYLIFNTSKGKVYFTNNQKAELILSNTLAPWSRKQLIRSAEDHLIKYYDIRKKGSWQLFF